MNTLISSLCASNTALNLRREIQTYNSVVRVRQCVYVIYQNPLLLWQVISRSNSTSLFFLTFKMFRGDNSLRTGV